MPWITHQPNPSLKLKIISSRGAIAVVVENAQGDEVKDTLLPPEQKGITDRQKADIVNEHSVLSDIDENCHRRFYRSMLELRLEPPPLSSECGHSGRDEASGGDLVSVVCGELDVVDRRF
jgi:hypothetical protein